MTSKPRTTARKQAATAAMPETSETPDQSSVKPVEVTIPSVANYLSGGPAGMLQAGLKALNEVRGDLSNRSSRVFQAVLGMEVSAGATGTPGQADSAAREHFDGVFDHRVAQALDRLGYPSAEAMLMLHQRLDRVVSLLEQMSQAGQDSSQSVPPGMGLPASEPAPAPTTEPASSRPARKRAPRT